MADATYAEPFPRKGCRADSHQRGGGCFECCHDCNYDQHQCPGCGEPLWHDHREIHTGEPHAGCTD